MLRLPKRLDGGRRRAATAANKILLSMSTSRPHRRKSDKSSSAEKALKKVAKLEAKEMKKLAKMETKAMKKEAKMEGRRKKIKRSAECVVMDVANDGGIATATWLIFNTGEKPWDDVKVCCLLFLLWSVALPDRQIFSVLFPRDREC